MKLFMFLSSFCSFAGGAIFYYLYVVILWCIRRVRVRPRFFDQVEHQTTNVFIVNKQFSLNNGNFRLTKIMNRADKNWAHF